MSAAPVTQPVSAWIGEFVVLAALWGASFLFMRMGASEFGPLPTAGMRVLLASTTWLALFCLAAAAGAAGVAAAIFKPRRSFTLNLFDMARTLFGFSMRQRVRPR